MPEARNTATGPPLFPLERIHTQLRPSASRLPDASGADGEYRGFFPSGDAGAGKWKPEGSYFEARGKVHGGVDIYAPFALHPNETPVLSLCNSEVPRNNGTVRQAHARFIEEAIRPNKVGNRVHVDFIKDGQGYYFVYGHLSRFEGRARRIGKGDVIGFAGCTGNADTQNECSHCGQCNVNSGHVHLMVLQGMPRFDPLDYVKLDLRFGADHPQAKELDCAEWTDPDNGHGLLEKWVPPPPPEDQFTTEHRAKPILRVQPVEKSDPFALLELADEKRIEETKAAYQIVKRRLERYTEIGSDDPRASGSIERFLTDRVDKAQALIANGAQAKITELKDQIIRDGRVIGLENEIGRQQPGWLMRHISCLEQMIWHAALGPAMTELYRNTAGISGADRYRTHRLINDGQPHANLRTQHSVQCGAAFGGYAWLSASHHARNALGAMLDVVRLPEPNGQIIARHEVLSVTFGAGSLMHATISQAIIEPAGDDEVDQAIATYWTRLRSAVQAVHRVYMFSYANALSLSADPDASTGPGGETKRLALNLLNDRIRQAVDAFDNMFVPIANEAHSLALLTRVTDSNLALFERVSDRFSIPEKRVEAAPEIYGLRLEPRPSDA